MNNYITYGYCLVDGDMRMDSGQSEAVHLIFDAYDGGESIKKIVGMLKDRKAPTTRGKPSWTPVLIRKILRNKDYLGVELPGFMEPASSIRLHPGNIHVYRPFDMQQLRRGIFHL